MGKSVGEGVVEKVWFCGKSGKFCCKGVFFLGGGMGFFSKGWRGGLGG